VVGVYRHVDGELAEAVDDRVGEFGVEACEAHHPAGLLVHHGAHHFLVGV
jgi:hypothetical protein